MTCQEVRELFSMWVDDALTGEERDRWDLHLVACPECQTELARFRQTIALVREMEPERAPIGFVDRVVDAARPRPGPRRLLDWLFHPLSRRLPVHAAALALVTVGALYLIRQSPELQHATRVAPPSPAGVGASRDERPGPAPSGAAVPSAIDRPMAREQASRRATEPPASPSPTTEKRAPTGGTKDREAATAAQSATTPTTKEAGSRETVAQPDSGATGAALPARPPAGVGSAESKVSVLAPAAERLVEPQELRTSAEMSPPAASPSVSPPGPTVAKEPDIPPSTRGMLKSAPLARDVAPSPEAAKQARSGSTGASGAQSVVPRSTPGPLEISGRLLVENLPAARQAVAELVRTLGGREVARREDATRPAGDVVEVDLPGPAYARLVEGLGGIGRWRPDREPSELPPLVRVLVRFGD